MTGTLPAGFAAADPVATGTIGLTGAVELCVVIPCFNERANVAPLVAKLDAALAGLAWEAIFVDDDSPDGTIAEVRRIAAADGRVRGIRRIGRRGLASAVIEGALATSARFVAVIDGDLQHDETRLPAMLAALRAGDCDLVVASRYAEGGSAGGLADARRQAISRAGVRLAQLALPVTLTDPLSGFFALPRSLFESVAPRLTGEGFKILLDLVLSAPGTLRVREVAMTFRQRQAGESKLSVQVLMQFAALLFDKAQRGLVPLRFVSFALIGGIGVGVNLAVLRLGLAAGLGFEAAQIAGTVVAMVANFQLNNRITYRDERLRGPALWWGLALFMTVCGIGAVANVGIAQALYASNTGQTLSGAAGAVVSVVWNYTVSATLVWRRR